ncbi:MAG TPA: tetratricopeptide repeat protein [Streptosporangiaceae bacterium]|nr:tetratricopeptide repeat protein [Streptosporangiaceae bacterium]
MQQPRDFSMAGAVDLGARQAAAKRREQASQGGGTGAASSFVFEVTDATFNTDVVARSQSAPVIVDLWAEWCEPCKQLGPVLERLANEAAGDWLLAKVDVDANPQLAAALQVQSIPMVVAVIGGQLVDGFLGALPEAQVKQWISQILQVADQLGMPARVRQEAQTTSGASDGTGPPAAGTPAGSPASAGHPGAPAAPAGPPSAADMLGDQRFETVQNAMEAGDLETAATTLEQVLADTPGHPVATSWLAQVDLLRRVSSYDLAKVRQAAQENPDDPDAQTRAADTELADGQVDASFDRLLGLFQRTAGDDRDRVRRHLLGLFDVLPPRDPRVTKARSRLSSLLF